LWENAHLTKLKKPFKNYNPNTIVASDDCLLIYWDGLLTGSYEAEVCQFMIYTVSQKTSPTFLAITRESTDGFL